MPESKKKWVCVDIPLMDYEEARELQLRLVEARQCEAGTPDTVLLLEHPSVYTVGRRGGSKHLMVPEVFLKEQGISFIHVERGGDITYHGPGQLIAYPIVDLQANKWPVVDFVYALEEVMIKTAGDWGIQSERNPLNRGVWVGMSKIGSVGIAVRRGVSFHGLALNVNTNLEPFGWINPCGLEGIQVTSMKQILGRDIPMEEVRRATVRNMREIFQVQLETVNLKDFYRLTDSKTEILKRKVG